MKKVFLGMLALSFVTVMSCGGGSTATTGQSTAAASSVAPIIAGAAVHSYSIVNSINIDSVDVNVPDYTFDCETSGTAATSGTYSVDGLGSSTPSVTANLKTTFNACVGKDSRCDMTYELGGSMDSVAALNISTSDYSYTSTTTGTVSVTLSGGTLTATESFDCPIDTKITFATTDLMSESTDVSTILSKMTGTICGVEIATLKTAWDGTNAEYCALVEDVATAK